MRTTAPAHAGAVGIFRPRIRSIKGDHRLVRSLGLDATAGPYYLALPSYGRVISRWIVAVVGLALVVFLWPARFGGVTSMTIVSGQSMEPRFHTGDLLITRARATYAPGDVLVYQVPDNEPGAGMLVVHRLVSRSANGVLVLRGDNNDYFDPFHPTDANVVGKSVAMIPVLGRGLFILGRPLPFAIAIGVLAALASWRIGPRSRPNPDRATAAAGTDLGPVLPLGALFPLE